MPIPRWVPSEICHFQSQAEADTRHITFHLTIRGCRTAAANLMRIIPTSNVSYAGTKVAENITVNLRAKVNPSIYFFKKVKNFFLQCGIKSLIFFRKTRCEICFNFPRICFRDLYKTKRLHYACITADFYVEFLNIFEEIAAAATCTVC